MITREEMLIEAALRGALKADGGCSYCIVDVLRTFLDRAPAEHTQNHLLAAAKRIDQEDPRAGAVDAVESALKPEQP